VIAAMRTGIVEGLAIDAASAEKRLRESIAISPGIVQTRNQRHWRHSAYEPGQSSAVALHAREGIFKPRI